MMTKEQLVQAFSEVVDAVALAHGTRARVEKACTEYRQATSRLLRAWKQAFGDQKIVTEVDSPYMTLRCLLEDTLEILEPSRIRPEYIRRNLERFLGSLYSPGLSREDDRFRGLVLSAVHRRLQNLLEETKRTVCILQGLESTLQEAREALDAMTEALAPYAAVSVLAGEER